jgi:RNA polymerase sigma factor (sigma-70 family)
MDLVEKILQGEADAYIKVIEQTENIIARIVWTMIPMDENRRSIVQEVYLKAYKNLPAFKSENKLTIWVAKIAYDNCLLFLDRKGMLFDGLSIDRVISEKEKDYSSPASTFRQEIYFLPPIYRTLICLFHYDELNYEEIGQIINLPGTVVKDYLFKARKLLKNNLLLN